MSFRSKVLASFKKLHRTRQSVFEGDARALSFTRDKINTEFRKNKDVTDTEKLNELLKLAIECEDVLRTTVMQGVIEDNKLRWKVKKDHVRYGEYCEFNIKERYSVGGKTVSSDTKCS